VAVLGPFLLYYFALIMTTEEADKYLKDLGFINPGHDFQKLWAFGKALVGDREMHRLKDLVTGNYSDGEEQILRKCAEDSFFRIIHSQKYDLFRQELIWLDEVLPKEVFVADLGCHTGHITAALARMRPSSRFMGFDCLKKPIEKANLLRERFSCVNLSFEHRDAFDLQISPKPDGLISLQGVGLALSSKALADAVCNIADIPSFFIIVERFENMNELKAVYDNLAANGFICAHQHLLMVDSLFCKGAFPGFVFTKGHPNDPISFEKLVIR
jgi:hypothetical protein